MTEPHTLSYQSTRLPRWVWVLLAVTALGLLCYTIYRAATLSITFDEAWSRNTYASASWGDILWFRPPTANNHPGNSMLMKISMYLFGDSTFSMRLPNLLAHVVFLFYSLELARRYRQPVWVLLAFFLLNFHPYVLDFFSLARGYGLAMAMVMGAAFHLFAFRENAFSRHLAWNVTFATLAVFFNFSFLHFFLANGAVLFLLIFSHVRAWMGATRKALWMAAGRLLPLIVASVGLYLYMRAPVKALVEAEQLYYGGPHGFWTDTVFSLAHTILYKIDFWKYDVKLLQHIAAILLLAMLATFLIDSSERKFRLRESPGLLAFLLVCIPAFTSILQHYWADSLYLIYRTALFWVPLFMIALVWLLRTIAKVPEFRWISISLGIAFTLGLAFVNVRALNLTHTSEWVFDADTKGMMRDLEADWRAGGMDSTVTIGLSWHLRSGVNYYRRVNGFDWLKEPTMAGCQPGNDYYYVLNEGEGCKLPDSLLPFGAKQGAILLHTYPVSNTALWKMPAK
jgi:hypothetical protein